MADRSPVSSPPDDVSLLPVLRALVETHSAITRISGRHIESLGLTPSQFDVIATLGDTAGMTCKAVGDRTLITKGTLTPVLDRLEAKGLITRSKGAQDGRQILVTLTPAGQALYEQTFMTHVGFLRGYIDTMPADRQTRLIELLGELRRAFGPATTD